MSWDDEPNGSEHGHDGHERSAGFDLPATERARREDPAETLDNLERFYERDRGAFSRMAAVQDLGPELREALSVLLTLPPDALETLTEIARMPVEEQQLIHRAVSLPDEIQAALRGLLRE